jgi:phosphate transport system protein
MGDHATNIAEIVHFTVTGRPIEDSRPKSDDTSYAIVMPRPPAGPAGDRS